MSAKPKTKTELGPRSTPTDFHPCPGTAPQGAWMNILLTEDDGMNFNQDVALTLKQWELHNLITMLWHRAQKGLKEQNETIKDLDINFITTNERTEFPQADLDRMKAELANGLTGPIVVRIEVQGYVTNAALTVAAAKALGYKTIPCIVELESHKVYMKTAQKLENHWQRSLRRSWVDRR